MAAHITTHLQHLEQGKWDDRICSMYGTEQLDFQKKRYTTLLTRAISELQDGDVLLLNACGRAELGGNHTDHNLGHVLAAGVHLDNIAVVRKTDNMIVTVYSEGFEDIIVDLSVLTAHPEEFETPHSIVRGVASGLFSLGYNIGGFSASVTSSIPIGSSLSSSAAFEVLVSTIFNWLLNSGKISPLEIAQTSKDAENNYFNKPCGFMDQSSCAFSGVLHIDFGNPESPIIESISIDFEEFGYQLAIVETGGDHSNLTDEYAAIPNEMRAAARSLGQEYGKGLTENDLFKNSIHVRKKVGDRAFLRLFHFIGENRRAIDQAKALQEKNIDQFLRLVRKSGDSSYRFLQNCASIQDISQQPIPVALAMTEHFLDGQGACRVHGGGFAGTIQVFIPTDRFLAYQDFMEHSFGVGSVIPLHVRQPGSEYFEL